MSAESSPKQHKRWGRTRWLAITIGTLVILGLAVIAVYSFTTPGPHGQFLSVGLLTALAALFTGSLFGFLFGIPRIVSSGELRFQSASVDAQQLSKLIAGQAALRKEEWPTQTSGTAGDYFTPSTNLAEVSDWLTKLLLGAGLVQLTRLGGPNGQLINSVALGLSSGSTATGPAKVMAGTIMVVYWVLGFITVYVLTTIWYGGRLERALRVRLSPGSAD